MLQTLESGNSIEDIIKKIESNENKDTKKDNKKKDDTKKDDKKKEEPKKDAPPVKINKLGDETSDNKK